MENVIKDLRYAVRVLLKRPGFTAVAIITLALGIGANSAIFSVINSVLLRPLPYKNPDQLVWLWEYSPKNEIEMESTSLPNFTDWRSQNQSFEAMGAFANTTRILSGTGEPERIPGAAVTDGFFSVLAVEPIMGRAFAPEENMPGNHHVVILSHNLWQSRFGSDSNIAGSTVTLNSIPHTVVGVMPSGFLHPQPGARQPAEFWIPLGRDPGPADRRADYLNVIARLKPGLSIEQAQADMQAIAQRLEQQYPDSNSDWHISVLSLHERFVGDVRAALLVLLAAVCFLLLIACANVANLLLARASSRQKEIAIRTALGAGRRRIIQQLLTESVLLSIVGGALGLLLAMWGVEILLALSPGNIPRLNEISLDTRVLVFTFGMSVLTGMAFGLLPALQVSSQNLSSSLKEGGRSSGESIRGERVRKVLVTAEIAMALVMLIGAGLMVKSFARLQTVNPGFNPDRVLAVELLLPPARYKDEDMVGFHKNLLNRVENLPGVQAAGTISRLPLAGGGDVLAFAIEGRQQQPDDKIPDAEFRVISTDYFNAMSIPLSNGRYFTEQDSQDSVQAVIINEKMAKMYWPGEDPLNKRINLGDPQQAPWLTIVGVVGDTRHEGLNAEPYPQMYVPYAQIPRAIMALVARSASDPMGLVSAIRGQVWEIDSSLPLHNVRTMGQVMSESIARPRFNMTLIAIFAAVAMLLAVVGIYGVISYSVTQRTHEIGIRMALGAGTRDIFKLVIGQGMVLAGLGVAIGLAAAFALTRLMESLLFAVEATDVATFALVSLILTGVALVACFVPARRAMKVDPMVALRYE